MNNPASPLDADPLAYLTEDDFSTIRFQSLADVLSVPQFRFHIARKRWHVFQHSGGAITRYGNQHSSVIQSTVDHNIDGVSNSLSSLASLERSELVFRPVMALDKVYSYRDRTVFPELKVLLVGSRTEYEVLLALSYGVNPANLAAVDLISYSPWITPGDMHELPYDDNTFDLIVLGWVLAYSSTPARVADELVRVARPGGVVSIGNDCYTHEALKKSKFFSENRPNSLPSLLALFGDHVKTIYFSHEPEYSRGDIEGFVGHLIATFSLK